MMLSRSRLSGVLTDDFQVSAQVVDQSSCIFGYNAAIGQCKNASEAGVTIPSVVSPGVVASAAPANTTALLMFGGAAVFFLLIAFRR